MASIATNVFWATGPNTYFDFSYEKKREGSTQYYSITVSCRPVNGNSYFGYPIYVSISLDGSSKASYTLKNATPSQWGSAIANTTGWLAVSNKTSGTTALAIRIYSGSGSSRDKTFNYTLAIDPAISTISCTDANIESNPTITITRASSNLTHKVDYKFGSLTGVVVGNTSATSITNWQIPATFYAQIPNAKRGECTLTCTTYSGSTPIGTSTCKFWATTDETKCKPTVSGTVVDINPRTKLLTNDPNILVRYVSEAQCTITATTNKNAEKITQKTINNVHISGTTMEIANVETGTFDFYAKDSREYFNSAKVVKTLVPYVVLTNDATAYRDDPTSGNATLIIKGNYFNGNFGYFDNELSVKYKLGDNAEVEVTPTIKDNEYSVTVSLSGLDYTKAYKLKVAATDQVSSAVKELTIKPGVPVFDWGENDFRFNVPVAFSGGQSTFKQGVLNSDANDVTYNAILRTTTGAINCPSANGFLIAFSPLPGSIAFQIGCDFKGASLMCRTYWWGTWYDWKTFT